MSFNLIIEKKCRKSERSCWHLHRKPAGTGRKPGRTHPKWRRAWEWTKNPCYNIPSRDEAKKNKGPGPNHLNLIQIKGRRAHRWQPYLLQEPRITSTIIRPSLNSVEINKALIQFCKLKIRWWLQIYIRLSDYHINIRLSY